MAERRMFAKTIVDSDMFLDLPQTSQNLYFHLGIRADDDGFVNNPKKIIRMIGASQKDLEILVTENFVIPFESGICVIKHWKIHNYIQKDRYKKTVYTEEFSRLNKVNNVYNLDTLCIHGVNESDTSNVYQKLVNEKEKTEESFSTNDFQAMDTQCIHDVSSSDTQDRLGKDRLGKDSSTTTREDTKQTSFGCGGEIVTSIINKLISNNLVQPSGINSTLRDDLDYLIPCFSEPREVIELAIADASRNNAKSWKYVYTILNTWIKDEIKSLEEARKELEKRGQKNNASYTRGESNNTRPGFKESTFGTGWIGRQEL